MPVEYLKCQKYCNALDDNILRATLQRQQFFLTVCFYRLQLVKIEHLSNAIFSDTFGNVTGKFPNIGILYPRRHEAKFLDKIKTKVFGVFLIIIYSQFTSTALLEISIFFKLSQPLTVSLKEKGGKQPKPFPYDLRNPYRKLKSENSQVYAKNLSVIVRS